MAIRGYKDTKKMHICNSSPQKIVFFICITRKIHLY